MLLRQLTATLLNLIAVAAATAMLVGCPQAETPIADVAAETVADVVPDTTSDIPTDGTADEGELPKDVPGDGPTDTPGDGPTDTPGDGPTDTPGDISTDGDGDAAADGDADVVLPPFEWPLPTEDVSITAHESWKNTLTYHDDPFKSAPTTWGEPEVLWVKFAVLMKDPTKVYFQHSGTYAFHYNFATERLDPFIGLSPAEFDALSLHENGQQLILGAVVYSPLADTREIGIQLVRQDAYHPEMVRIVFELVRDAVVPEEPGDGPITAYYFPSFEQIPSTLTHAQVYVDNGVPVSSVARWGTENGCYSDGWAIGKLTEVPGDQIEAAYTSGALKATDILLTNGVPAEVPHVAGITTLTPSTPNSHVAILAATFGVPFAHLASDTSQAQAQALVGKNVLLRVNDTWGECSATMIEVPESMSQATIDELLALKAPAPLDITPKSGAGPVTASTDTLSPADIGAFGGKAANFGLLRDAIPDNSPQAIALSFALWDQFMAQTMTGGKTLGATIDDLLNGYSWPPDVAALSADLAAVRDMIKDDTVFSAALQSDVIAALAPFTPTEKIRFRSSTNVEDSGAFTGAGLYDSYSGCLADDQDGDEAGPSLCDPSKAKERGVFRAIRKVFASFYNANAFMERLRFNIDPAQVGMALLVHHSFPDEFELANGVARLRKGGSPSFDIELVTQAGAVSVTNPEGAATPEEVGVWVYGDDAYPDLRKASSLVPLGGKVMAWEDDYVALANLLVDVAEVFAVDSGKTNYELDFEYKKIEGQGLVVKQVREIPMPSTKDDVPVFLMNKPESWCIFQGEYGDALGNHRMKARFAVQTRNTWLDAAGLSTSILADLTFEHRAPGDTGTLSGDPASWAGFAHVLGVDGQNTTTETSWTTGSGADQWTWTIATPYEAFASANESPVKTLADFFSFIKVTYPAPQPTLEWSETPGFTTSDYTRFDICPEDQVITGQHSLQDRFATGPNGETLETSFYWPPGPTGVSAGYTAPLVAFVETTITGFTTEPMVLTGYWAQTYRPGHHNFTESLVFEPAVAPGVTAAQLAELETAGIRYFLLETGFEDGILKVAGPDMVFSELK